MSAESVALDHYQARQRLTDAASSAAQRAWAQVDPAAISASWQAQVPPLTLFVSGAQMAAAQQADPYVTAVLAAQGVSAAASAAVDARVLAGVASDGRDLASLLARPVVAALQAMGRGGSAERGLAAGWLSLDMIIRTQVADAGRAADQVALTARPATGGYVRMIVGKTCSRCLILAGRWYSWDASFNRHPRCDCTAIPASEDRAGDLRTDPKVYFQSLSREDQDKTFGKAGAAAIREGADMGRVVNARRGMYVAGGRQFTTEGTTRAGRLPGQAAGPRLMPEQILRDANGDRAEALRLLRLHGYLI